LQTLQPTPVIALNRAVAVAMADGPKQGLALIDQIVAGGELDDYHLLPATRAELLRRSGLKAKAAESYRRALELVTNDAERRFLEKRLLEVEAGTAVV
jgi:RNA polymerase sigma-70 factor, ECF subfamily